MAGVVRRLADGLYNALTGMGGGNDPRSSTYYGFCPMSHDQVLAAYRTSPLMRKCIRIPAFDSVRAGRDWQAKDDQIKALEAYERKLLVPQRILQAQILGGLGGGAIILGAPGDPGLPISRGVGTNALAFMQVVSRWKLSGKDWIDDATVEGYGGPSMWEMRTTRGQVLIHPSRVVAFPGEEVPDLIGVTQEEAFWGESKVQALLETVKDADTARQAFASLISKARSTIVGIPNLLDFTSTPEGEAAFKRRMTSFAAAESMFNVILHDAGSGGENGGGETIEHRQVNWAGIPEIIRVFAEAVSAAADIPMTRLWGKAAEGMSASGDSQQRDWNKMVKAQQDLYLRPRYDQLDAVLITSAIGSRPAELWWDFAPLDTPTEAEETARFKIWTEAAEKVQNTGTIPDIAFAKAYQNGLSENGWMPGLDGALAELSEDERFGLNPDPDETDPSEIVNGENGGDPESAGAAGSNEVRPARRAANDARFLADAAPRTLYIERKLLNADEVIRWVKSQGLETTLAAKDMHVTIAYSRTAVDWFAIGSDWSGDENGKLRVKPGGPRAVERLGDGDAVALLFSDESLEWRHKRIRDAGASWDWPDYRPHVTLSWMAEGVDVSKIAPYAGPLVFGPELFSEVNEDWKSGVTEK